MIQFLQEVIYTSRELITLGDHFQDECETVPHHRDEWSQFAHIARGYPVHSCLQSIEWRGKSHCGSKNVLYVLTKDIKNILDFIREK